MKQSLNYLRSKRKKTSNISVSVLREVGALALSSVRDYSDDDIVIDFGKLQFVVDKVSVPYINGMTLDWRKEGFNEIFKFINPKEKDSCGCGVSINFDLEQVEVDKSKIFAVEI